MPRPRSLAGAELKIGIVAARALALAATLIVAVGGAGGRVAWQRYQLKTRFVDVKGLKSGAVVRVAGVEVGKVSDVRLADAEVEVTLEVRKGNERRITTESRASIGSLSLLGEPVIDISPSVAGTAQGRRHHSFRTGAGQLSDVADAARASLEQVNEILKKSGRGEARSEAVQRRPPLQRSDRLRHGRGRRGRQPA
jgi:phospholipid/cholesterol/gamma-HCH transport system substrate-binding protein